MNSFRSVDHEGPAAQAAEGSGDQASPEVDSTPTKKIPSVESLSTRTQEWIFFLMHTIAILAVLLITAIKAFAEVIETYQHVAHTIGR